MKKENKQEELQSRREFFKSAAKAALPVIGAVVLSALPDITQAQYYRSSDPTHDRQMQMNGCQNSCRTECINGCQGCKGSCTGTCYQTCQMTCQHHCTAMQAGY